MREKIHSFWESFAPSAFFFATFLIVWIADLGTSNVSGLLDQPIALFHSLENTRTIELLQKLELLKLLWIAVAFLIGFSLYLFDRVVAFIGGLVPPNPAWHGSSALLLEKALLAQLWMMLPSVNNVAALDFEARTIIDQANDEEHKPAEQGIERYLQDQFSSAARLTTFAKVGVLWVLVTLVWAVALGRPLVGSTFRALLFLLGFAFLGFVAIARETHWLLRQTENMLKRAISILYSKNIRPIEDLKRWEEFNKAFENSVRHAPRLVHLSWGSLEGYRRLYRAFFGIPKESPPAMRDI